MISFEISKYGVRIFGFSLIIISILFFAITAIIFFYKLNATSQLSSLNVNIAQDSLRYPNNTTSNIVSDKSIGVDMDLSKKSVDEVSENLTEHNESLTNFTVDLRTIEIEDVEIDSNKNGKKELTSSNKASVKLNNKDYTNESIIGPEQIKSSDFLEDYQKVFVTNDFDNSVLGYKANYMSIPIINLNSRIEELQLIDLEDNTHYNTPKNVVGHIPDTNNPGETGNAWYFGHLQSPLKDEGDVFRNLPLIPEKMKEGFPVYIVLNTDIAEFAYQVISTEVIHQDNLNLYNSELATVTLVTCVPKLIYDHRLVVTARLVGVRNSISSVYKDLN